jgi:hypothetical protein
MKNLGFSPQLYQKNNNNEKLVPSPHLILTELVDFLYQKKKELVDFEARVLYFRKSIGTGYVSGTGTCMVLFEYVSMTYLFYFLQ